MIISYQLFPCIVGNQMASLVVGRVYSTNYFIPLLDMNSGIATSNPQTPAWQIQPSAAPPTEIIRRVPESIPSTSG